MALKRQETAILLVFALWLILSAFYTLVDNKFDPEVSFAGEYGNLAENMVLGNGFSGPFEISDHGSAWMPPLLSLVIAVSYLFFGIKSVASAKALVVFQILVLWLSLGLLLLVARRLSSRTWPVAILFSVFIWMNRGSLFQTFHDQGFTVLLSCLALYCLNAPLEKKPALPMLCGLVLPLGSPALALAYAVLTPLTGAGRKRILMVLFCCGLSVSCWTVRNAVALRAFVPLKSNLWFDFDQANVKDVDGIVSDATFFRFHPLINPEVLEAYREGEMPFMGPYRLGSLDYAKNHPGGLLRKALNRLVNATLFLRSEKELVGCAFILEAPVQAYLMKRHLVLGSVGGAVWCCLDLDPDIVKAQLEGLDKSQRERLFLDWQRARKALAAKHQSWGYRIWGLAHTMVPFLAILIGIVRPSVRGRRDFQFAAGLYILYLAPYVLVSHYARYQISLMGLASYLTWNVTVGPGHGREEQATLGQ